jgi:hypothetical protein
VTNRLTCSPGDFSKGVGEGAEAALQLITAAMAAWEASTPHEAVSPTLPAVEAAE